MKTLIFTLMFFSISLAQTAKTEILSREKVRQAIKQELPAIKKCYEAEMKNDPKLKGKIVVEFEINEQGAVQTIRIKSSSVESISLQECVMDVVSRIRFPSTPQGEIAVIDYPFVFDHGVQ